MPRIILLATVMFATTLLSPDARAQEADAAPVRIGVVGLTHGHVGWILGREQRGDVEVVGIAEADRELALRYAQQYGFSMDLVFASVEEMLDTAKPEAVTAFNDVAGHLQTVEAAARRGVHVMVEKPLHFSLDAARRMQDVADSAGIHLLTNYETTWYPTTAAVGRLVDADALGTLRKVVVHDGHQGPAEIGVGPEFLSWLTDPELNGGGALIDFGCYGANLITWLLDGARPLRVTAITQTHKPDLYPDVDDDATIVLEYPGMQGVIQASWNWPYSRKDMEVYGTGGTVVADDAQSLRLAEAGASPAALTARMLEHEAPPSERDPFAYLAAVVRGEIDPTGSLSSLDVNMAVVEILDAARRSARESRTITLEGAPTR